MMSSTWYANKRESAVGGEGGRGAISPRIPVYKSLPLKDPDQPTLRSYPGPSRAKKPQPALVTQTGTGTNLTQGTEIQI